MPSCIHCWTTPCSTASRISSGASRRDKPAAGQITVTFRDMGAEGIEMTVHDDGAGIDVDRIGRAAVTSGLLTEATLGQAQ